MVKTPQRVRRFSSQDKMINLNIDAELKHALQLVALKSRTSMRAYVTCIVEEAVAGSRARGAPERDTHRSSGPTARLVFRIDAGLRARLQQAAEADDATVTDYLAHLIEQAVSGARGARGGRG
ncbi:MAG: hypothetical protein M3Q49_20010 [Actinomycetota bacterium]|nr:hypothetical protein [Actinomycetota bacterium]